MKHSKIKTEKEVVNFAKNAKNISLMDLKGKIKLAGNYNYIKLRKRQPVYRLSRINAKYN